MKQTNINEKLEKYWQLCIVFCLTAGMLYMPELAFAESSTTDDGISSILCKITEKLTGPIGRGISTIAVVVLGIGLFLGKLSWGLAIATAIGIGMIFSAGKIVNWLSGTTEEACSTS